MGFCLQTLFIEFEHRLPLMESPDHCVVTGLGAPAQEFIKANAALQSSRVVQKLFRECVRLTEVLLQW